MSLAEISSFVSAVGSTVYLADMSAEGSSFVSAVSLADTAAGMAVDTGVNTGVDTIAGTTNAAGTADVTTVSMAASSSEPLLYFACSLKRY